VQRDVQLQSLVGLERRCCQLEHRQDSSVSKGNGYGLDDRGSNPSRGTDV
jgi:hypothetical protein